MSGVIPAVWILIWVMRAIANKKNPQEPSGGSRPQENIDGPLVLVALTQGIAVLALIAPLGEGWLGFFFSVWLVVVFPQWAAWRLCQPLGLRRLGSLCVRFVIRGPVVRKGRRRLFEWSLGAPDSAGSEYEAVPADGWTTCAAALRAEAAGNVAQAERLSRGLADLPERPRVPRVVARVGFELLAFAALRRGDMKAVLLRASLGRGRGCRFLRLLARARLAGDVPAPWLWIAWALAPRRRRTLPEVKEALKPRRERAAGTKAPPSRSPWSLHLRMMRRAAAGRRIDRARVLRLARRWDGRLGAQGQARLRARAIELGVLDPEAAAHAVYTDVLEDLEALAAVAVGPWPQQEPAADSLSGLVQAGAENRLFANVEPWVEPYREGKATTVHHPLTEWDRWLEFRETVDQLEDALGEAALSTSWYGGLRQAAWNWPCRLFNLHQQSAAWVCHVMFEWTAGLAERVGDEEAAAVNRENAAAAASMVPR